MDKISEVLNYRRKLLSGDFTKEEFKIGLKCLNEEQLEAFERVRMNRMRSRLPISNSMFGSIIKSNSERRANG